MTATSALSTRFSHFYLVFSFEGNKWNMVKDCQGSLLNPSERTQCLFLPSCVAFVKLLLKKARALQTPVSHGFCPKPLLRCELFLS